MRRREFVGLLGGAAAWPLATRAQQTTKLPTIGFLGAATASIWAPWTAAFQHRLRELGWTEGRFVAIEYRWAEGRSTRFAEIATEFARINVNAIVTAGSEPVVAAKQVTSVVPIIFALAADPVGAGLVASLARPGRRSLLGKFQYPHRKPRDRFDNGKRPGLSEREGGSRSRWSTGCRGPGD